MWLPLALSFVLPCPKGTPLEKATSLPCQWPWPWPHICSLSQVQSEAPQAAQPLALTLPSKGLKPGPASLTDHPPFINLWLRLLPSGSPTSHPTAEAAWSRRGERDRCPWLISLLQAEGDGEKARWPSWTCIRPHWALVSHL